MINVFRLYQYIMAVFHLQTYLTNAVDAMDYKEMVSTVIRA